MKHAVVLSDYVILLGVLAGKLKDFTGRLYWLIVMNCSNVMLLKTYWWL